MSVIKISQSQKERLLELYHKPTNEIKSKDIPAIIEQEMGFKVPYLLLNEFYNKGFNLDLSNRKRKSDVITFEFEGGETIKLTGESDTPKVEVQTEVVGQNSDFDNYEPHPKEPVNLEF